VPVAAVPRGAVGLRDASHGHVGAVDEEDEDGEQADQGTQHAEADDAAAPKVQTLHDIAAQEGAPPAGRHHDDAWRGEQGEEPHSHSQALELFCVTIS